MAASRHWQKSVPLANLPTNGPTYQSGNRENPC
jgi:hypothetical protein